MERLEYDLLFRWFVGIGVDDPALNHSVFSKNRDRLLEGDIAAKFLAAVLAHPRVKRLLSSDHFLVDGTLIQAWASMKSLSRKMERVSHLPRAAGAMWKRTSTGRNGPTRRMLQPPILTLGSTQGTRQGSKALLYGA